RLGDVSCIVPGPITDVGAAPGSQAVPGLRDIGIVWQGFSSGHRTLAATATLDVDSAAPALPLAISIEQKNGQTLVHLKNTAARKVDFADAVVPRQRVRRVLGELLRGLRGAGEGGYSGLLDVDGR